MAKSTLKKIDSTPPIQTISLVKGKKAGSAQSSPSGTGKPTQGKSSGDNKKPKHRKQRTPNQQEIHASDELSYEGYSTLIRTDLKKQLEDLKKEKAEARRTVCTLKQFVELAILAKFDAKESSSQIDNHNEDSVVPEYSYEPFRTEYRRDLLPRIRRWKNDQRDRGDKKASVKSFIESAISDWLESQADLPSLNGSSGLRESNGVDSQ